MTTLTIEYDASITPFDTLVEAVKKIGARVLSSKEITQDYVLNKASVASIKDSENYKKRKRYSSVSDLMNALNS